LSFSQRRDLLVRNLPRLSIEELSKLPEFVEFHRGSQGGTDEEQEVKPERGILAQPWQISPKLSDGPEPLRAHILRGGSAKL